LASAVDVQNVVKLAEINLSLLVRIKAGILCAQSRMRQGQIHLCEGTWLSIFSKAMDFEFLVLNNAKMEVPSCAVTLVSHDIEA